MNAKQRKKRVAISAIVCYLLCNGLIWGLLNVYVNSYNIMHYEQLNVVEVSAADAGYQMRIAENVTWEFAMPDTATSGRVDYQLALLLPDSAYVAIRLLGVLYGYAPR